MNAISPGPDSRPVLAFAHANGIPGHSYDTFLAPFAERFDVRVAECLGHDPKYPVDRNLRSLSQELEAFLEPLPKPLLGLGHSMGAGLMFLVAERRPEWFQALILLDPALANGPRGWFLSLMRRIGKGDRITPAARTRGRLDYWDNWDDVLSYFRSRGLFRQFDPRALDDYLEHGLERHGEGWRLRFRPHVEADLFREVPTNATRLPPLSVPGILITGEKSPGFFQASGRRHARRHHLTQLFAPGGHMFPLQTPEATAERVLSAYDNLLMEAERDGRQADA